MDQIYKSIVSKWYASLCVGMSFAFVVSIYLCYSAPLILLINVVMMGIGLVMIYDILLHTDYTIKGERLIIRCGVLYHMNLSISQITEISHRSTILSSPALSSKRIGLKYGRKNWVYISPQNQEEFIETLLTINPLIKIF